MFKASFHVLALALPLSLAVGCSDTESTTPPTETPPLAEDQLVPPPAGEGFQFATGDVVVPPGVEEQDCYFFKASELAKAGGLPSDKPFNLHRIELAQRTGSHHMNLFRVKTIVALGPDGGAVQTGTNGKGECFKSANWADWPLIANTQQEGRLDWTYPEGVANTFEPDEWIMLQTHFVNAASQKTPEDAGRVTVNFWTIPDNEVQFQLGTLFATKQSIRVCESNPTPTFEGSCQFNSPEPVNIIGANGHFHSRGTEFDMYSWDGTTAETPSAKDRFYTSEAWDDPPMMHSPELDLQVPAGAGVWYSCSYEWSEPAPEVGCEGVNAYDKDKHMTPDADLDCCYTFGPIVEKNEHCNIFVYYYPKIDDVNCF